MCPGRHLLMSYVSAISTGPEVTQSGKNHVSKSEKHFRTRFSVWQDENCSNFLPPFACAITAAARCGSDWLFYLWWGSDTMIIQWLINDWSLLGVKQTTIRHHTAQRYENIYKNCTQFATLFIISLVGKWADPGGTAMPGQFEAPELHPLTKISLISKRAHGPRISY